MDNQNPASTSASSVGLDGAEASAVAAAAGGKPEVVADNSHLDSTVSPSLHQSSVAAEEGE